MAVQNINELYARYIQPLPHALKWQVVERIAQEMTEEMKATEAPARAWAEIRGTAPNPLVGEDAQDWVTRSRQEDDAHRENLR